MRVFYIVMEIIWLVLGLFCLYLAIRLSAQGVGANWFYLLAAIAFAMAAFRFFTRRRREKRQATNSR